MPSQSARFATGWEALPEAIHHGVNSFLAPAGDEEALAQHLARPVADADLRCRMGAASRLLAERHSMERGVARYGRLYREVAAASPPPFPPAWMRRAGRLWRPPAGGLRIGRGAHDSVT